MEKFRFLTSGESHGKCLNAIVEGIPAGFRIKASVINEDLARRQAGYGRGERMQIEHDTVEIKSGVRFGKTTGAPICLEIKNKDWENWQDVMNVEKQEYPAEETLRKIEELIKENEVLFDNKHWFNEISEMTTYYRGNAEKSISYKIGLVITYIPRKSIYLTRRCLAYIFNKYYLLDINSH